MAPITVTVNYDKRTPVFFAGQVLSGNVVVCLKKPVHIIDVYIAVKGKGKVEFTTDEGTGDDRKTVQHNSEEVYIDIKALISQTSNVETYESGQSSFSFSVILPGTLPESFQNCYGEVKYKCTAIVKYIERFSSLASTCKESKPFSVHAQVPVPDDLLKMQRIEDNQNLPLFCCCCCCFSSGVITGVITIDKGGYIPGNTISCNAHISNKTKKNLECITISIKKTIDCIADDGERKTSCNEITKAACLQGIPAGEDYQWPVSLKLPNTLPPTNLGSCKIIQVSYCLEVDIGEQSGCCSPEVHFRLPFVVGSAIKATAPPLATTRQPEAYAGFPQPLVPGYPPAPGQPYLSPSGGYPPAPGQPYLPPSGGYPPAPGQPYLPPSGGYPPQPYQPDYPPSQPGYMPVQPGYMLV